MSAYHVNLYLLDRAYGGPEEGGWWYDCGEFQRGFTCYTAKKAERIRRLVQRIADARNTDGGNHDLSSVLCEGRYEAHIERHPGKSFPTVRPHYE